MTRSLGGCSPDDTSECAMPSRARWSDRWVPRTDLVVNDQSDDEIVR